MLPNIAMRTKLNLSPKNDKMPFWPADFNYEHRSFNETFKFQINLNIANQSIILSLKPHQSVSNL